MDKNCQIVVFSDKAYNAIIRETFEWEPVETGGILLGHILDNGCWIVMEVLPPGYGEGREGDNVYHEYGYFEYNQKFVNYLAKSVAEQYDIPLELLGLWHRHPGSMDHFSKTDDITNTRFALQNPNGTISGLINVDPQLRMTMFYMSHADADKRGRVSVTYQEVQVEVGSDLIPEEYFRLRYFRGEERDLHPYPPQRPRSTRFSRYKNEEKEGRRDSTASSVGGDNTVVFESGLRRSHTDSPVNGKPLSAIKDITDALKKNKTQLILLVTAIVVFGLSISSIKKDYSKLFDFIMGGKPSIENPIRESLPNDNKKESSKVDIASDAGDKEDGDSKEKENGTTPEPAVNSQKSGEKKENSNTN